MPTLNLDESLRQILRELSVVKREMKKIHSLIHSDVRTADRLISVSEACKILGYKKSQIYQMIASGELPARKESNKRYKLSFNQVQKYIQS